jgi:hypothetical protein
MDLSSIIIRPNLLVKSVNFGGWPQLKNDLFDITLKMILLCVEPLLYNDREKIKYTRAVAG